MKILLSEQFLTENSRIFNTIADALHFVRLTMKKEGIGMYEDEINRALEKKAEVGENVQFSFRLYKDSREMIRKLNVRLTVEKEGIDLYYDLM